MAFPSSTGSIPITLESGWETARQLAAAIKAQSQFLLGLAQSSGIAADQVLSYVSYLNTVSAQLTGIAAITGMSSYAQTQVGSTTLDVAAAFNAMQTALSNVITWVRTNFPKDASGNLLFQQWGPSGGQFTYTQFSAAVLTGFATQLSALIATID